MRFFVLLFSISLLMTPGIAQDNSSVVNESVVVQTVVKPKPGAISHNIVFVIDASSTMYDEDEIQKKFHLAWSTIVNKFAGPHELYFRVYLFSDKREEMRSKWIDAGGPLGLEKFQMAKRWIDANAGVRSWGLRSLRWAMRDKCPLDKNPASNTRLTVVLITDGGFTEAAGNRHKNKKRAAAIDRLAFGTYLQTGSFEVFDKAIAIEQDRRKRNGLARASIITIGIQNDDPDWGTGVKRPDSECQAWLRKTGEKYGGGYLFVKRAPKRRRLK